MAMMSHRHTIGSWNLGEKLATQKESILNCQMELEGVKKKLEGEKNPFLLRRSYLGSRRLLMLIVNTTQ